MKQTTSESKAEKGRKRRKKKKIKSRSARKETARKGDTYTCRLASRAEGAKHRNTSTESATKENRDSKRRDFNIKNSDYIMHYNGGKHTMRTRLRTRETRRHERKTQTRKAGKGIPALSYHPSVVHPRRRCDTWWVSSEMSGRCSCILNL